MGAYGSPELQNFTRESNMILCTSCGTNYPSNWKKCPNCGKKPPQPFHRKWWVWGIIIILFLYCISLYDTNPTSFDGRTDNTGAPSVSENKKTLISEDAYKAACISISYNELARNPHKYMGQSVFFQGQVIQVLEDRQNIVLRVAVAEKVLSWEDVMYVTYQRKTENESRILEKDMIKIYGEFNGIKEYTAVLGNQIAIPYVDARYINLY